MGLIGEDLLRAKGWLESPDAEYFPQTGQWVSGSFLKFYRERGGPDDLGLERESVAVSARDVNDRRDPLLSGKRDRSQR